MRLKQRLQLIGIVAILAGGAIALVVGHTTVDIRRDIERLALVHEVERASSDLVIVMQEYALHGEPRARVQWEQRHALLLERLSQLDGIDTEAREQRERVALHAARMQRQFDLLADRGRSGGAAAAVDRRADELLVGQLLVESYVMTAAASQLATLVTRRVDLRQRRGSVLITALVAVLALGVVVASVTAWRGLGRGLERLRRGASQVAGGDLSVRMGPDGGVAADEIDEVAIAIDASTTALGTQRGLLSLSHRMSMAANASDSAGAALRTALQVICEFTGWPVGHALMQPRSGAGIVSARIWHGADDARFARLRAVTEPLRFDHDEPGVVASVVRTRKLRFVAEVDVDTNPLRAGAIREAGLHRHVAMPVLLGDEVAAVLEFFSADEGGMSAALLDTLEQIGVQLGRVFERERARAALSEEARARARTLLALSARVASAANQGVTLRGTLKSTLDDVCVTTGWPVGHALLRDPAAPDTFVTSHVWHLDDADRYYPVRRQTEAMRFGTESVSRGVREAASSGEPLVIERLEEADEPQRCNTMQACGLTGQVFVPVVLGRDVVAVLELMSRGAMQPEAGLIELLRNIGLQLGRVVEREQTRETLSARAEELARSNAELESFAYVASHDLQEPLRMVASYAQLLERRYADVLDDKARRYLAYAVEGATRMQSLVNGLLQISRVGSHGEPHRDVDLQRLMQRLRLELKALLEETGATLEVGLLPVVHGDPEHVAQVLRNLISNAVKFQKPGTVPHVRITADRRDTMWCLSVADNGIGIEIEYAAKVFQIFQRLHSREDYPGTGIGLTLCKKLVERHGGRIWFESEPGKGTTFHFTLPAAS